MKKKCLNIFMLSLVYHAVVNTAASDDPALVREAAHAAFLEQIGQNAALLARGDFSFLGSPVASVPAPVAQASAPVAQASAPVAQAPVPPFSSMWCDNVRDYADEDDDVHTPRGQSTSGIGYTTPVRPSTNTSSPLGSAEKKNNFTGCRVAKIL